MTKNKKLAWTIAELTAAICETWNLNQDDFNVRKAIDRRIHKENIPSVGTSNKTSRPAKLYAISPEEFAALYLNDYIIKTSNLKNQSVYRQQLDDLKEKYEKTQVETLAEKEAAEKLKIKNEKLKIQLQKLAEQMREEYHNSDSYEHDYAADDEFHINQEFHEIVLYAMIKALFDDKFKLDEDQLLKDIKEVELNSRTPFDNMELRHQLDNPVEYYVTKNK